MIHDADIPAETVRAFAAHLGETLGVTFVSPFPAWLDAWFSLVGMTPSGVTIGRTVYTPNPIGPTLPGWSGWDQIATLTHEAQHVVQGERRSLVERAIDYATSTAKRTAVECECFAAEMELEHWRRGKVATWWLGARASSLGSYHVKGVDLQVAERYLRAFAPTVRRYGYVSRAGRVAIEWLDAHAPELRHPSVPSRGAS
jgi:hypothetical protein